LNSQLLVAELSLKSKLTTRQLLDNVQNKADVEIPPDLVHNREPDLRHQSVVAGDDLDEATTNDKIID